MVALGIANNSYDERPTDTRTPYLRDTAEWFPSIPDESLCLNESSYAEKQRRPLEYRLLAVVLFGGSKGVHLRKLIGITLWARHGQVCGMDFIYNTDIDGRKVHTLGLSRPLADAQSDLFGIYERTEEHKFDFQIDGRGGELITSIDMPERDRSDIELRGVDMYGLRVSSTSLNIPTL